MISPLTEFLLELKGSRQPAPTPEFKLNCKFRQKLILKEGKQLSAVLNHPTFQENPLTTSHQHLESTQPISDEKPKKRMIKMGRRRRRRWENQKLHWGLNLWICDLPMQCYQLVALCICRYCSLHFMSSAQYCKSGNALNQNVLKLKCSKLLSVFGNPYL
ncbi:hypothetical protein JRO89_XS02G0079900 [Xanthoceras sorbifolium]|uniref:Uncharacterized protein n=1 Tax=Xanthoceras sorbifolium TaxID=99658 RepID=A0ABQ8IFS6_9ROSI|nr:hypothetical protein JRO89_XS02G0079900 [Xanthoceras sorbifolium]